MRRGRWVAVAVLVAGLAGCSALRRMALEAEMNAAPTITNPAVSGMPDGALVVGADGTKYSMLAYSAEQICFGVVKALPVRAAQGLRFQLRGYMSPEDDDARVPSQANGRVRVVASHVESVPVEKTVTDTIKDDTGKVIATQERVVQMVEQVEVSELEVCFGQPAVLGVATQYLVLYHEDPLSWGGPRYGIWRLVAR